MATAFMILAALRASKPARSRLLRYLGLWLLVGVAVSYGGYRWWELALPDGVRSLFLGASPALQALASTRQFLLWSLTATLGLGTLFLLVVPRAVRLVPALLIMAAAFAFFGGYERLREGCRKPYLIHDFMFSNGIRVDEITQLNEKGVLSKVRWAAHQDRHATFPMGQAVFRAECASCHTIDGYQAIRHLLPDDVETIQSILEVLSMQGETIAALDPGETADKSTFDYPFMPPFVGTEEERQALAQYLASLVTEPQGLAQSGGTP
jgi:cytochrome d ubiquinol oxidase subunit I